MLARIKDSIVGHNYVDALELLCHLDNGNSVAYTMDPYYTNLYGFACLRYNLVSSADYVYQMQNLVNEAADTLRTRIRKNVAYFADLQPSGVLDVNHQPMPGSLLGINAVIGDLLVRADRHIDTCIAVILMRLENRNCLLQTWQKH